MSAETLSGRIRASWRPGMLLQAAGGLLLIAIAVPAALDLPRVGTPIVLLAAAYSLALLVLPRLWMLWMPLLTVAVDLTPWTGRFLFSEYDVFVLATLGASLLAGRLRGSALSAGMCWLPFVAYLLLYAGCLVDRGAIIDPPGVQYSNPYYLPAYSYKVGKGVIWALLLAPLWLSAYRDNPKRTVTASVAGLVAASLALGLLGLWERGTLAVLATADNWWRSAHAVLDFSSDYRTTGIFADMHTGGEVIDGLLILLLPLALFSALRARRLLPMMLAFAAVLALGYMVAIGITRATWATAALAMLLVALLEAWRCQRSGTLATRVLMYRAAAFLAAMALARFLQVQAGSDGVLAFVIALGGVLVLGMWHGATSYRRLMLLAVPLLLAAPLATLAHLKSRYAAQTPLNALLVPLAVLGLGAVFALLSHRAWPALLVPRLRAAALLVLLPGAIATVLGGYSMGHRLGAVGGDLETRMEHWRRVVASGSAETQAHWLGNGVGSFPRRYVETYPETLAEIGSFEFTGAPLAGLRLGVGDDLAVVQRVAPAVDMDYAIELHLLPQQPGVLRLRLCRQNQLVFDRWTQPCRDLQIRYGSIDAEVDEHGYEVHRAVLNSGGVGAGRPWLRWPVEFQLLHRQATAPVHIASLRVVGADGEELLRNGDFAAGGDHWFFHANFAHLPWHVKNLWLQVWYETGWLGLVLLLLLMFCCVAGSIRREASPLAAPVAVAVLSVGLLGFFGSPLDSARVSTWFYTLLFIGVLLPREPGMHAESGAWERGAR